MAHRVDDDPSREKGLTDLLKDLARETTTLFRQEVELAKAEIAQKAKQAGAGAGMFGGAAVLGLGAFGALTAMLILALAIVMPATVAALIVMVVYAAIAAFLAMQGRQRMREAAPPMPEQTVETVKEDVEWLKTRRSSETA
jgi:predicted lipid-binding transport protein (Tim44 family)